MKPLSIEESCQLQALLNRARFPLHRTVFDAWVENLPTVALELAIVRRGKNGWEIFMAKRPRNDKHWPGEWNEPGTVIRQGESTKRAYKRLLSGEMLSDGNGFGKLRFVGVRDLLPGNGIYRCRRGHELSHLYVVEYHEMVAPKRGKFFPIDRLPRKTVPHHHTLVKMVRQFLEA